MSRRGRLPRQAADKADQSQTRRTASDCTRIAVDRVTATRPINTHAKARHLGRVEQERGCLGHAVTHRFPAPLVKPHVTDFRHPDLPTSFTVRHTAET